MLSLKNRWLRAVAAAAVVAMWPACSANRPEIVPTPSLDFVLKDMNGKDVRLADFKGRPLIINFWATWCPPCKQEIPWFVDFATRYKDQHLAVVGISVDDPPADILKFAADHKVNYPMLVGDRQTDLKTAFAANEMIPVSWLIKPDGTVLARADGFHAKDWFETQVAALVAAD